MPYEGVLSYDNMSFYFKSYVRFWINRDYEFLEDIAEPFFVKSIKKELELLPKKYKIVAPNIRNCKLDFDLYDVKNIFMSQAVINRKKSDSVKNYHLGQGDLDGVDMYFLNKKRASEDDRCGLVMQFSFNVFTDLNIQVLDENDKVILSDIGSIGKGSTHPHDFKIEILACEGKHSSLQNQSYKLKSKQT